ncbi:cytochrome P450 [Streptomyces sp. NPDC097617]|uniref:cytochrome P450 n=1 Tax=Streptomyces sp. NPDC097617 TaxID=3366091 RepID=UPI0037F45E3F
MSATATSSIDLLDERALESPYPVYEAMRRMGPAVYLERHGVWAIPRYDEVSSVLGAPDVFRAEGDQLLTPLAGVILPCDGEQHVRMRQVLAHRLAPRAVARLQGQLADRARQLVAKHSVGGGFDAVALAHEMAVSTVMDLMGLPESTRVPALASAFATSADGSAADVPGPPAEQAMVAFLSATAGSGTVRRGSWMETIVQAVEAGKIDGREAIPLAAAYTAAGIDSTVLGLAGAIVQLSRHPDQWSHLREEPSCAEAAFHEAVRLDAPVQGVGRLVRERVYLDGVRLEPGERVWLLIGSAGRDPRKWGLTTDEYNPWRPGADKHLSLGTGSHGCPGRYLALMQGRALLRALADHCTTLTPDGAPTRAQTHIRRGFTTAPIAITTVVHRAKARRATLPHLFESPR